MLCLRAHDTLDFKSRAATRKRNRHPSPPASVPRNPTSWVPLARRKKRGTLLGAGHRNLLEALQEVDASPPLVAVLRARPARRLLIEISVRALRRKSGGHRSEIACRINRTMTGTRSPPPLSPTARLPASPGPHGAAQPPPLFARAGHRHARRRRAAAAGAAGGRRTARARAVRRPPAAEGRGDGSRWHRARQIAPSRRQ